jgi:hypothetical protein
VIGGLAADNDRITRTWVLHAGRPQPEVAAAVGLYGDRAQMTHGARGGCESFGAQRVVTRSQDKILFELAGRPAHTFY